MAVMKVRDRYVNGEYINQNTDWHDSDAPYKAGKVIEVLKQTGHLSDITSVCDVGCGTGGILENLKSTFPFSDVRFVGYEPSPQARGIAAGLRAESPIKILQGDNTTVPDGWDLLLAIDVFEHVEDYFGFLRSLRGKSRLFAFHIPLDMTLNAVLRSQRLLKTRKAVGHLHYFQWDTALATVTECGYTIDAVLPTAIDADQRQSMGWRIAGPVQKLGMAVSPKVVSRILGGVSLMVLAH
jgi:SAM-dependent methyltransferase